MGNIIELIVRKQRLWVIIFNICFLFLGILALYNAEYGVKTLNIKIEYGEEYSKENFAQIFYAESEKDMNEEMSCKGGCSDTDSTITVNLTMSEYQKYVFRLDPINISGRCTIKRIVVSDRYGEILDKSGKAISGYIRSVGNVNTKIYKDEFAMYCLTDDPCLVFNSSFNQDIIDSAMRSNLSVFYAITILYIIFGITQIVLTKKNRKYKRKWIIVIRGAISSITLALGGCLLYGENYLTDNFSDVPLGQLLYHLHTPLDGTNTSSFTVVIISIILIIVLSIVIVLAAYWGLEKLHRRDTVFNWISIGGCMASAFAIMMFSFHFDVANYLKYINEESTIYEDEYVDGSDVEITFPSQKRNLIYIFLESMEMTYADTSVGGAMDVNYIPELTTLSLENENFGTYGKLNGAYTVPGATFTMGGLVAQTSGIPINENIVSNDTLNSDWQSENNYVPGVYAIGDVLEQQGYNQEFLIGSNGKFAGRSSYFIGHGDYKIFDYYTAIDRGYIDEDYKVWWGYEDKKLFEYAKDEILELACLETPFNLTMLTVDTHFTDGYVCDLCENEYDEQYSNVIACSSRQVAEFVEWIKEQPFYDNTTIVISGDHLTMDSNYIERNVADDFNRRTYFTIINGDAVNEKISVNREYTTLDIYPTTLAAMGARIDGNRLGLGINLYSGEQTLLEKYGQDYLDIELIKDSKLYRKEILYVK